MVVDQEFLQIFPNSKVQHLNRNGSNHSPLHVSCKDNRGVYAKSFRFLNFWVNYPKFKELVKQSWEEEAVGSPFYIVHQKLKRLKRILIQWSRNTFWNFFQKIATLEDVLRMKEAQLEINPSEENRRELQNMEATLRHYYKVGEEYWKQKAGMQWFRDGDRNTKFVHSYVKGRRIQLRINNITNDQGKILHEMNRIGSAALSFFTRQFSEENNAKDYVMLDVIPKIIIDEQNQQIT